MKTAYLLIHLVFSVAALPALAAGGAGVQQVVAVKEDGTLVLSESGNARLESIAMPDMARAQSWLAQHALQQRYAFKEGDDDRYGRLMVSSPLQAAMLRDGAAVLLAHTPVDEDWVAAQQAAHRARRGLWGSDGFVLTPQQAAQHAFAFHAVEGTITRIYKGKHATYLNFGERWQEDFSVMIPARNRRSFEELLAQVKEGSRIVVLGTIFNENGPMIRITRPEQLLLP